MHRALLVLLGMMAGAGIFATGLATGMALMRHHDDCDEPESTMRVKEVHHEHSPLKEIGIRE